MINYEKLKNYNKIKNEHEDYKIIEIDGKIIKDDKNLRKLFDDILKLPAYCGSTMDAVHDCFYDKNWTKGKKIVLLIKNVKDLEYPKGLIHIFKDIIKHSKKMDDNFTFKTIIFKDI